MKKKVLFHTNLLVCCVIVAGFLITAYIGYQSNQEIIRKDTENVSSLTSEGIYHNIDTLFTKPIHISQTMANDSLLKDFLNSETEHLDDTAFIHTLQDYLDAYREKYSYDSVFLASTQTKNYYYFNGLDRTLDPESPENTWFYDFLEQDEEYSINIDNDEVDGAGNQITIFVNCRIKGNAGQTMGVVGVGFRVNSLQGLLQSYETKFGVKALLMGRDGSVEVATDRIGMGESVNFFDICAYPELKNSILEIREVPKNLWYSSQKGSGFVISRFIPNMNWYLIVENDTTELDKLLANQLLLEVLIVLTTIILVLFTITRVMKRYNRQIIELTVAREQKHRDVFQKATEQLYENIYEIDITHNRAASKATAHYFESLGAPPNISFDKALQVIAQKQIKEEFQQGYLETFSPQKVEQAFKSGTDLLRYDFMITNNGNDYYWMRITAHIFHWGDDNSVRMLVYRQNIDDEKRRELFLYEQMQKDPLTKLYNKVATQDQILRLLQQQPKNLFAFYILDIDDFKKTNDRLGHAMGDKVLVTFAKLLEAQFPNNSVVGRIGGDEFVAFVPVTSKEEAVAKAELLSHTQYHEEKTEIGAWNVSASIGVALAPEAGIDFESLYRNADLALYQTKRKGKNSFTLYQPLDESFSDN